MSVNRSTSGLAGSPLGLLCECLAAADRGGSLDDAGSALNDPSTDFVQLARLAGRHLITPILAACLSRCEAAQRAPADFRLYLQFIQAENRRRNATLSAELAAAAAGLNRIGVEPVLLKGAIRLADGLYRDPGWRFMRDLDLLVPRAEAPAAAAQLRAQGYVVAADAAHWPQAHRHLPRLARGDEHPAIELHLDLLSERCDLCPAEGVLARSRAVEFSGSRVRLPDPIDQLVHLIAHDRLDRGLRHSGSFLLRSLFETALLCRDGAVPRLALARFSEAGLRSWAGVHLHLAGILFPSIFIDRPKPAPTDRLRTEAALALELADVDWRLRERFVRIRRNLGSLMRPRPASAYALH